MRDDRELVIPLRICTAEFEVSNDLLHQMLNLPVSSTILRVDYQSPRSFTVTVSDRSLLPEGHSTVVPTAKRIEWSYNTNGNAE